MVIRELRNRCAHDGGRVELNASDIRVALEQFLVPHRQYFDWGQVGAASTPSGFVLYNGERPGNAVADLSLPGSMTFNAAIGVILYVLAANLEIPFATDNPKEAVIFELPPFMRLVT